MNRTILPVGCTLVVLLGWPGSTLAADHQRDLASAALAVFSAKCADCHGPQLARPEGRFGYVTDLRRVANNPELVVPLAPDESELWEHVRRDEMPPEDAPSGPLSMSEKDVIRAWIAAGAPNVAPAQTTGAGKRATHEARSQHSEQLLCPSCRCRRRPMARGWRPR
jgi:mono/diheme cytochrome c family protein